MISGLNQEVDVLGRTFHFQTELTRRGDLFVRTEVFVGGKVVATREYRLVRDGRKLDEESVLALMKEQHGRVIERTLERVQSYQERKRDDSAAGSTPTTPAFDAHQAKNLQPPADELREAASTAIRIRRIFGKFRLRLDLGSLASDADLAARLQTAARGFTWIISSPMFQEIRLDEQMRCHLVSDRVNGWIEGGRDPAAAAEIWSEIIAFNAYVAEINNRTELLEFDRQLLMWAAYQVQSQGMSDDLLDKLQWLAGRDLELDRLLDRPKDVSRDTWFALLCRVLNQTPAS
ncbi:MAG: hypothetical protein GY719_19220 [bacterium]|nr:hypothetical protein [bacterium]